ncbi:beta-galactosidase [Paenibacillus alginolyticus]|uniref:Beta-galactosidase n=1 Tax=Paenibacillus alginolyticus TaxID=59839 RepID=A0ABT4G8J7_9BACL|nr:beta-galactosidase [Paenibacillus alginolyticus]MCY9668108.1 beta-galactosidase [Paenibacillus alginolyticus]MCY9692469.1 beta-galactosidase [Paenibacillus alginolyticus]MEC0144261.1 beta-galactosidase [Paenibacillus alginolyticus]
MERKLYHGTAYYPELWDERTMEEDIRYMKEAGINVVRMGEFAWAKMEPEQDKIDLSFFAAIIRKLYENGIQTIMCTPTPTPPIWLSHNHPERMFVDAEGRTMSHGARQHACTNHPFYRERSRMVIEALAKAVGRLPGVIGWQTDNEFKCHVAECYCETCKGLWHEWLRARYGTIEKLNEAWGTQIWSQLYQSFKQVPQPVRTPFLHNSSLSTMYRMFSRDKIAEFQDKQLAVIRRYSDAPITHNDAIGFQSNHERMFANLDFASFDGYPNTDQYMILLMNYDLWRNVKPGVPFWVMETSTSHNGHLQGYQKTHKNGFLTAEAVAAYALGAQGFSYWLWRQQRTGCEQPHGAVLSAWGKPTVGYQNVQRTEQARKEIEPLILSTKPVQAELAITWSDSAKVFFQTESLENLTYQSLIVDWYTMVAETGLHRDLLFENADLDGHKVLMSPFMPYMSDAYLERAKAFVEEGGIWIVGPMSGGRTEEHTVHMDAGLGKLDELAGVETLYTFPVTDTGTVGHAFGEAAGLSLWSALFEAKGATVIGTVEGGAAPETTFLTEKRVGKGKIVMLGSMPEGEQGRTLLRKLVNRYAEEAGVTVRSEASVGTAVAPRISADGSLYWFVINMDGNGGCVILPRQGVDALMGEPVPAGRLEVGPYSYRAIKFISTHTMY